MLLSTRNQNVTKKEPATVLIADLEMQKGLRMFLRNSREAAGK
jgi:hypothetical protein